MKYLLLFLIACGSPVSVPPIVDAGRDAVADAGYDAMGDMPDPCTTPYPPDECFPPGGGGWQPPPPHPQ